jgi:hypothetical protein
MKQGSMMSIDAAGAAALVGLTAAVYFCGVSPAMQAVEAAEQQRSAMLTRREECLRQERKLTETQRKLDELQSNEPRSLRSCSALDRISRISELAAESGVSITDVSPRPEVVGTRFNRVPVNLAGVGSAKAFQSLLHALHKEFPDTQVASLTITGTPENRLAPASFSAELVWYTVAVPTNGAGRAAGAGGAGASGGSTPKTP